MPVDIYLEAIEPITADRNQATISLESYVCLFVHRYLNPAADAVRLFFVQPREPNAETTCTIPAHAFSVDLTAVRFQCIDRIAYGAQLAALCAFPVLVADAHSVVAGLCGVCRGLIKASGPEHAALLGFKGGCLLAPSVQSVWTRFCEVDVIDAVVRALSERHATEVAAQFVVPAVFGRFEVHMKQPVRMHNIYKVAREQQKIEKTPKAASADNVADLIDALAVISVGRKSKKPSKQAISSSVPMHTLDIAHTFAEGQHLTLADLMLFASFDLFVARLLPGNLQSQFREQMPLTSTWLAEVRAKLPISDALDMHLTAISADGVHFDLSDQRSLYKNDSKRYKPLSQIFTKQPDIEAALEKVAALRLAISSQDGAVARFGESDFAWWSTLPFDALPEGGALPADRLLRKKHQLQSLAVEVLRLVRPGHRVVDFCSGAGHLGIVIAALRPDCEVLLLENKEESLLRARDRVDRLRLLNVRFVQCNLDYFVGAFEVGTSLHACGVATDIVLELCMQQRAAFVSCPCCYGSCRSLPHIRYPRSRLFAEDGRLTEQDCLHVAHCADQAHDIRSGPCNETKAEQGQLCMDVMDWDRKLCAEERGYEVVLTRLQPENCTPKNRLLVGRIAIDRM